MKRNIRNVEVSIIFDCDDCMKCSRDCGFFVDLSSVVNVAFGVDEYPHFGICTLYDENIGSEMNRSRHCIDEFGPTTHHCDYRMSPVNLDNDVEFEYQKFVEHEVIPALTEIYNTYLSEHKNDTMFSRVGEILSRHKFFNTLREAEYKRMEDHYGANDV